MTFVEYYEAFRACLPTQFEGDFPRDVAAHIAAGYAVGLTPQQLLQFHIRYLEIRSVTVGLVNERTSPDAIAKIIDARQSGCVYPKEVLAHAFAPKDVRAQFHEAVFVSAAQPGAAADGFAAR
jgi:hypothetical protein